MRVKRYRRHRAKFLAPEAVGSSIRYVIDAKLHESERTGDYSITFDAELNITDCDNQVRWEAYGDRSGVAHMRKKLLAALQIFEQALDALDDAEGRMDAWRKRYKIGEDE